MGVCFVSYAVSDANIAELLADPPLVWRVVEPEDESSYLRELSSGARTSLLGRIFGKAKPAPEIRNLNFTQYELRLARAEAYASVTEDELLATYRSVNLQGVYPSGLWKQRDLDAESYLTENFADLQAFVSYTREHKLGAVIQFT